MSKTLMSFLLLSLIGQGMVGIIMACETHHDNKSEAQVMDHSMMSHHEMNNHHSGQQPANDMVQHDCCDDEASCLMSSCVAATYLAVNLPMMIVNTTTPDHTIYPLSTTHISLTQD